MKRGIENDMSVVTTVFGRKHAQHMLQSFNVTQNLIRTTHACCLLQYISQETDCR